MSSRSYYEGRLSSVETLIELHTETADALYRLKGWKELGVHATKLHELTIEKEWLETLIETWAGIGGLASE